LRVEGVGLREVSGWGLQCSGSGRRADQSRTVRGVVAVCF